jgi:hypothetical protein
MESDRNVVFIDSSVLSRCGRPESTRFQALAREARQRDSMIPLATVKVVMTAEVIHE